MEAKEEAKQAKEAAKEAAKAERREKAAIRTLAHRALPRCSLLATKLEGALNHPQASKVPGFAVKAVRQSSANVDRMLQASKKYLSGAITSLPFTLDDLSTVAASAESNSQLMATMAAAAAKHVG